jgi:hypothetical protein
MQPENQLLVNYHLLLQTRIKLKVRKLKESPGPVMSNGLTNSPLQTHLYPMQCYAISSPCCIFFPLASRFSRWIVTSLIWNYRPRPPGLCLLTELPYLDVKEDGVGRTDGLKECRDRGDGGST